ncbi:Holliday junction resolvase RuvX [Luteococcus sp. H138]|uniref:Holliday junction resolvase RuvX n=1 Tax=unclassified Luteococcus TaxID=2639923 RepID=UPI00406C1B5A
MLLALDWGKARIGVAACDAQRILAYPVDTVQNTPKDPAQVLRRIAQLVAEYEPVEVLLGLPISLKGDEGIAAQAMRQVAVGLEAALGKVPLTLVDERLTSATAHKRLEQAGKNARQRRGVIDQMAAVAILEQALAEGSGTATAEDVAL